MAWMLAFLLGISTLCCFHSLEAFESARQQWVLPIASASAFLLATVFTPRLPFNCFQICKNPVFSQVCFFVLVFALGFLRAEYGARKAVTHKLPADRDGELVQLEGFISRINCSVPDSKSASATNIDSFTKQQARLNNGRRVCRLLIEIHSLRTLNSEGSIIPRLKRVHLSYYGPSDFDAGQAISATAKLRALNSYANPGSFDSVRYNFARGIDARGYIKTIERLDNARVSQTHFAHLIRADRVNALAQLFEVVPKGYILYALLLGEKQALLPEQKQLLVDTGTIHLMAISGLHISIAAGMGFFVARIVSQIIPQLLLYWPRVYLQAAFSIPLAAFYSVLAGLSVPTQRALIMLSVFILFRCLRIEVSKWAGLVIALTLILFIDPLQILDTGLWYSFFAVAVLVGCFSSVTFRPAKKMASIPVWKKAVKTTVAYVYSIFVPLLKTQWMLFLAMPLLLAFFSTGSPLVSPIANLIAVPIISLLVVPIGILAVLFSYLNMIWSQWLLYLAGTLIEGVTNILALVSVGPGGFWLGSLLNQLATWQWVVLGLSCAISCGMFTGLWGSPGRNRCFPAYSGALLIWLVSMFGIGFVSSGSIKQGELVVTQFDVGQGSSLLLSTSSQHWLYDTGARYSETFDLGKAVILPYLKLQGVSKLDVVIVSHGDNDHIGGLDSIISNVGVDQIVTSDIGNLGQQVMNSFGLNVDTCSAGHSYLVDGFEYGFLSPPARGSTSGSDNDASCVLQVSRDAANSVTAYKAVLDNKALVLLPGDISRKIELQLVRELAERLASDLMVLAHHGSKSSTTQSWLHAVEPDNVLVSAGFNNRYGHPHDEVVARVAKSGASLYRSDELGAVQFWYSGGDWKGPYCQRYKAVHFWQQYDNSDICVGPLRDL